MFDLQSQIILGSTRKDYKKSDFFHSIFTEVYISKSIILQINLIKRS